MLASRSARVLLLRRFCSANLAFPAVGRSSITGRAHFNADTLIHVPLAHQFSSSSASSGRLQAHGEGMMVPMVSETQPKQSPLQLFTEQQEWLHDCLDEAGITADEFGLHLCLGSGALAGVVHQRGNVAGVDLNGETGSHAQLQPTVQADVTWLQQQLMPHTRHILYSGLGSESDYGVLPFVLCPITATATDTPATATGIAASAATATSSASPSATAAATVGQDGTSSTAVQESSSSAVDTAGSSSGSGGSGSESSAVEGSAWRLAAVYAALGISQRVAAMFEKSKVFGSKAHFLKHMAAKFCMHVDGDMHTDADMQQHAESASHRLADHCRTPFMQLVLGGEEPMYNPKPLLWAGVSPNGNLIGMISAVVWT